MTTPERTTNLGKMSKDEFYQLPFIENQPAFPEQLAESEQIQADVQACPSFGMPVVESVAPIQPQWKEFEYSLSDLAPLLAPTQTTLSPPTPATPPEGRTYPTSPTWTLHEDTHFMARYVYTAPYHLSTKPRHRERLLVTNTPPNTVPRIVNGCYQALDIPGMVRMVAGVPYVYHLDGDPDRVHTVACLHTLKSLQHHPSGSEISRLSVHLMKLSFGCAANGNNPEIPRLTSYNLKRNDRSKNSTSTTSTNGSYSLASTVLKGEGHGTVLPAVQVNTQAAQAQLGAVLTCLHRLRRLLIPLSVSKFEHEIWDFYSEINNVVSFGGLEPNGTSCQLNVSCIGDTPLEDMIGFQGSWHTDEHDDRAGFTVFVLLLSVGPTGIRGTFCLARHGLYVRELDAWILFLIFKGNDLHAGFAPSESPEEHKHWVESLVQPAWNHAGPENRMGYVIYPSGPATRRSAAMNITPAQTFGNFGAAQPHKLRQQTFATHGKMVLGGTDTWANRMGREITSCFFNSLAQCGLTADIDPNHLLQSISYRDPGGASIQLKPFPYHPVQDAVHIRQWQGYFEWYDRECAAMHIHISKKDYNHYRSMAHSQLEAKQKQTVFHLTERRSLTTTTSRTSHSNVDIKKIIKRKLVNGKAVLVLEVVGKSEPVEIEEAGLQGNAKVIEYIQKHLANSVPTLSLGPAPEDQSVQEGLDGSLDIFRSSPALTWRNAPETSGATSQGETSTIKHAPTQQPPSNSFIHPKRNSAKGNFTQLIAQDDSSSNGECRSGDSSGDDWNMDDDNHGEYDVESIEGFRFDGELPLWKIKWKGYKTETWESENNLTHCLSLLQEYNKKNGITLLEPEIGSKRRTSPMEKDSQESKRRKYGPIQLSKNLNNLATLLDFERLQHELQSMRASRAETTSKAYFDNQDTASMVTSWTEQNNVHTMLGSYLDVLPNNARASGGVLFHQLRYCLQNVPRLTAESLKLNVILRSHRWDICRSFMIVYNWYQTAGPETARVLMDIHRSGGYSLLKTRSPMFADLVDHIIQYVFHSQIKWLEEKKAKKAKRPLLSPRKPPSTQLPRFGPPPPHLARLPSSLYGLRPTPGRGTGTISLPSASSLKLGGTIEALYVVSSTILQDIWTEHVILPELYKLDALSSNGRQRAHYGRAILDRCIARGAILQSVADACNTDAIFVSSAIDAFICSPASIFMDEFSKTRRLASAIASNSSTTLKPLMEWVQERLEECPKIADCAREMGELVHVGMLELYIKRALTTEEMRNTSLVTEQSRPLTAREPGSRNSEVSMTWSKVTMDSLAARGSVGLGMVGLIIREALNAKHGRPMSTDVGASNGEILRRVLEGRHATRSTSSQHNPDHTNPIRQFAKGTELLLEHLPGRILTSRAGLSNLMSWFGTGQGPVTKSFLDMTNVKGSFFASDAGRMIQMFEQAISNNLYQHSLYGTSQDAKARSNVPGLIITHDPCVYGQPSNHFSLTPTRARSKQNDDEGEEGNSRKYTITEKFTQYFTSAVQDTWIQLLGDMEGKDPITYEGPRRGWLDYLQAIQALKIPGFQDGLTAFQLANSLVFLGIASMPSCKDISRFINQNHKKGAFRGLQTLGFSMPDFSHVHAAFVCVHDHLSMHLSASDKEDLGFSPIFTEHVLCKIVRWENHIKGEARVEFGQLGKTVEDAADQESDVADQHRFAFPLRVNRESVEKAIERAMRDILNM